MDFCGIRGKNVVIFNNMSFDLVLIYWSARRIVRVHYDILIFGLIPLLTAIVNCLCL